MNGPPRHHILQGREPVVAALRREAGPGDFYVAFRQVEDGDELFVSEDRFTTTAELDELIGVLRELRSLDRGAFHAV